MPEPARLANGGLSVSPRFNPARVLGRLPRGDESGVALSYAAGDPALRFLTTAPQRVSKAQLTRLNAYRRQHRSKFR
jgi:hypothetical protein